MDRNLYAPPGATVADPAEVAADRPNEVTWAMYGIWASVAIGVAETLLPAAIPLLNLPVFGMLGFLVMLALGVGVRIVIAAWVNSRIGLGRNWARILAATLFVLSTIYLGTHWRTYIALFHGETALAYSILSAVKVCINTAVVILLFTPRANRWFKAIA